MSDTQTDSGFKSGEYDATGRATQHKRSSGVALAGCPGPDKDDCKHTYRYQRHELFGAECENSPSTGWQGVYAEMEVSLNVGRR